MKNENTERDICKLINEVFVDEDKKKHILKKKCDLLNTKLYSMCMEFHHQVELLDLENCKFDSEKKCQNCNKVTTN
jgi:hypothetical protein